MKPIRTLVTLGLALALAAGTAVRSYADDEPAKPENPATPDAPAKPEAPAETPAAPETTPAAPQTPPAAPETPATPETPAAPEKNVEKPAAPEQPVTPEKVVTPEKPVEPEKVVAPPAPVVPAAPEKTVTPAPEKHPTTAQKTVSKKPIHQQLTGKVVSVDRYNRNVTIQVDNLTYVLQITDSTRISRSQAEKNLADVVVGEQITVNVILRELSNGKVEVAVLNVELPESVAAQGRTTRNGGDRPYSPAPFQNGANPANIDGPVVSPNR